MDILLFVIVTISLMILAIITSSTYLKKGYKKRAQFYPAIIIGSGLGTVVGVLAKGSFPETLVIILFLTLFTYSQFILITRSSRTFQSYKNKIKR